MDLERTLRRQPIKTARCTCGQPTWAPPRVRRSRRISYYARAARICYKFRNAIEGEGMVSRRKFLGFTGLRSEEHTSELQSQSNLVCRLLLEKKKTTRTRKHR